MVFIDDCGETDALARSAESSPPNPVYFCAAAGAAPAAILNAATLMQNLSPAFAPVKVG